MALYSLNKKNIKNILFVSFTGILFVLLGRPYFTWQNALPGYALIIMSFILVSKGIESRYRTSAIILVFVLLFRIARGDFSVSSLLSIFLVLVLLSNNNRKLSIIHNVKIVYAIVIGLSLVVYLCVVFLGIEIKSEVIDPWNDSKYYQYSQFPLLVVPYEIKDLLAKFRFFGIFEEPGNVATIATTFLIADKYNLKDWKNIIIFISGVFTFSMFFYVISGLYLFFYGNRKMVLYSIVTGFVLLIGISKIGDTGFSVQDIIESRFSHHEGAFVGDNRSNEIFDRAFSDMLLSEDVILGRGIGAHNAIAPGIQTYKMIIYDEGILIFFMELLVFIVYFFSTPFLSKNYKILISLYFLMFYYQRPTFIYDYATFFLLVSLPVALSRKSYLMKY